MRVGVCRKINEIEKNIFALRSKFKLIQNLSLGSRSAMGSKQCCCCCCLLFLGLFFIGIAVLFVFRDKLGPSLEASYKVTDAALTQFGTGSGKTLEYNLVANITVENREKNFDYKYDKFEAVATYDDKDLSAVSLSTFDVASTKTSAVTPLVFKGQKSLKGDVASKIKGGTSFDIVLKIKIKVLSRFTKVDIFNEYKVECKLKVPLINSKGKSSDKFESTDCEKVCICLFLFPFLTFKCYDQQAINKKCRNWLVTGANLKIVEKYVLQIS